MEKQEINFHFPKLQFFHHKDVVKVLFLSSFTQEIKEIDDTGKATLACINLTGIGINLDYFKSPKYFFRSPQTFLHEFLHWVFPFYKVLVVIHLIDKWTHGLIL